MLDTLILLKEGRDGASSLCEPVSPLNLHECRCNHANKETESRCSSPKVMDTKKLVVYFICTGNSCRSQMAEGWARHFAGEKVTILSGGIEAHGLYPRAMQVMQEAGVDMSKHTSKLINNDLLNESDYAITLCGDAYDKCPVTPPHVKRMH